MPFTRRPFASAFALLILLLLPLAAAAQPLTPTERARLDPRFRAVVADAFPSLAPTHVAPPLAPAGYAPDDAGKRSLPLYDAVVVTTNADALRAAGIRVHAVHDRFVTARVTPPDLLTLARLEAVVYVDAGRLRRPDNDVARAQTGAALLHAGYLNKTPYTGDGVVVCIIDTGLDFRHPDFRDPDDPTKSRVRFLWDVTLVPTGAERSPAEPCCSYGVEYTQADLEGELGAAPAGFVRSQDANGHGTHVAGTAAGNGTALPDGRYRGMAPDADLIVVKAGESSFTTANIVNALAYAQAKADALGWPMVVNMSLGGQWSPHDGSDPEDIAVGAFTASGAGRVVAVSAGNDGDSPIHIAGTLPAFGTATFTFDIPAYTPRDKPDNDDFEFNVWFDGTTDVGARLRTPNGTIVQQAAGGDAVTATLDGTVYLENYLYTFNGDRFLTLYAWDQNAAVPPAAGTWTLTLTNNTGLPTPYHGWLDDNVIGAGMPDEAGRAPRETSEPAAVQSVAVTLRGGDTAYTVGSPGTAPDALTSGAYVHKWRWQSATEGARVWGGPDRSDDLTSFTSRGPTRDGRWKPDLVSPGQTVGSAYSQFSSRHPGAVLPGGQYVVLNGTSMSSPVTAGAAALLLGANPNLTADEIKQLFIETTRTNDRTGFVPNYGWGYGMLDVFEAMGRVLGAPFASREVLAYDEWGTADATGALGRDGFAQYLLQFTPTTTGLLTGLYLHTTFTKELTGAVFAEVHSSWPSPGKAAAAQPVRIEPDWIEPFTWNHLPLHEAGVEVTRGADYYLRLFLEQPNDKLDLLFDTNAGSQDGRTYGTAGGTWTLINGDLRARVEVTQVRDFPFFNYPPVASADDAEAEEDTPTPFDVLANDRDPNGDVLRVTQVTPPEHGAAEVGPGGTSVLYTPETNYYGSDAFTYTAADPDGAASETATVNVNVTPVNDPPTIVDDAYAGDEDADLVVEPAGGVLANDTDVDGQQLSSALKTAPVHGTVTVRHDGGFTYTPPPDFFGEDVFTYVADDGHGEAAGKAAASGEGTVTITIRDVNDAPTAVDDEAATASTAAVEIDVLANDADPEDDALTVASADDGEHGTTEVVDGGTAVRYTPEAGFDGVDAFGYTVSDGRGGTAEATVFVTVTNVNTAPTAADDVAETDEDTPVDVDVLANDADLEGDALAVGAAADGEHGTTAIVDDGAAVLYTPEADFFGEDAFTYTVDDGRGASAEARVAVTVRPVNDPPSPPALAEPADGFALVLQGDPAQPVVVTWTAATDPEADPLTYTWQLARTDAFDPVLHASDVGEATRFEADYGTLCTCLTAAGVATGETVGAWHRVVARDGDAETPGAARRLTLTRGALTGVDAGALPERFALKGNYPNPFNPATTLVFDLPAPALVHAEVLDVLGRRVWTTPDAQVAAGTGRTLRLDLGALPSGLYLYRLVVHTPAETTTAAGRLMLLK